ncbi:MAG TPA: protease pro-enzyme activation domain-containing protein, partial [Polyangiaceae bacterium]|nr:protease pro-enzyme activation domain-containing protein [Polyangiaceae bacterium]
MSEQGGSPEGGSGPLTPRVEGDASGATALPSDPSPDNVTASKPMDATRADVAEAPVKGSASASEPKAAQPKLVSGSGRPEEDTARAGEQRFFVRVLMRERNAGAIYDAAKETSTPNHLQYGRFLPHERIQAFGNPDPHRLRALIQLFRSAGLEVHELENSPLVMAVGNRLTLSTFFESDALERVLQKAARGTLVPPWEWSDQHLRD